MLFRLRCGLSLLFPVCFPSLPKPISAPVTLYSIIVQVEGSVASVDSSSELRMLLHNLAIRNIFAHREKVSARAISRQAVICVIQTLCTGRLCFQALRIADAPSPPVSATVNVSKQNSGTKNGVQWQNSDFCQVVFHL